MYLTLVFTLQKHYPESLKVTQARKFLDSLIEVVSYSPKDMLSVRTTLHGTRDGP